MNMSKGRVGRHLLGLAAASAVVFASGAAFAEMGQPSPWEWTLQPSGSPVMDNIHWFHNVLLTIITIITLFVLGLLIAVMVKFNARANPVPSRTTHNTLIEVAWTLIPVLILVGIAVPSFRLLFLELDVPKADVTIKATGNQWNWTYAYPDDKIEYTSIMLGEDDRAKLASPPPRLLGVDHAIVVPVNKVIRVQTTGADVIHSFAVPAFGIKIDAIPGRLNETWFKAEKTGIYYGQCSELCGKDHAFMPIAVKVVSDQDYDNWKKCVQAGKDDCIDVPEGTKTGKQSS
jgi:cytochrome c oxidase subunit II